MRLHKSFFFGFGFGTIGLWMLSALSLMHPLAERIAIPFLWPGKLFASFFVPGPVASTLMVMLLFVLNGLLYGLIALLIWLLYRLYLTMKRKIL